jgi:hypothetical protein
VQCSHRAGIVGATKRRIEEQAGQRLRAMMRWIAEKRLADKSKN